MEDTTPRHPIMSAKRFAEMVKHAMSAHDKKARAEYLNAFFQVKDGVLSISVTDGYRLARAYEDVSSPYDVAPVAVNAALLKGVAKLVKTGGVQIVFLDDCIILNHEERPYTDDVTLHHVDSIGKNHVCAMKPMSDSAYVRVDPVALRAALKPHNDEDAWLIINDGWLNVDSGTTHIYTTVTSDDGYRKVHLNRKWLIDALAPPKGECWLAINSKQLAIVDSRERATYMHIISAKRIP